MQQPVSHDFALCRLLIIIEVHTIVASCNCCLGRFQDFTDGPSPRAICKGVPRVSITNSAGNASRASPNATGSSNQAKAAV